MTSSQEPPNPVTGSRVQVNYKIADIPPLIMEGEKVQYKVEPELHVFRFWNGKRTVLIPIINVLSVDMTLN